MDPAAAVAGGDGSRGIPRMPTFFIEAPTGIRGDAKKRLVEKATAALDERLPYSRRAGLYTRIPGRERWPGRTTPIGAAEARMLYRSPSTSQTRREEEVDGEDQRRRRRRV